MDFADDVFELKQHHGPLDLAPAAELVEIAGIAKAVCDRRCFDHCLVAELGYEARRVLERTAIMNGQEVHDVALAKVWWQQRKADARPQHIEIRACVLDLCDRNLFWLCRRGTGWTLIGIASDGNGPMTGSGRPAGKGGSASGIILAICVLGGTAVGIGLGQPSLGMIIGFGVGVAIAFALAVRRR